MEAAATARHTVAMSMPFRLLVAGAVAVLALTGCATPAPEPSATLLAGETTGEGSATSPAPAEGTTAAGPVQAEGMPELPLEGCGELVESEVTETDFDTQWSFEFACTSRDAFDASVAALDAAGTLAHTVNSVLGNDSYLSDKHHFIGEVGGQVLDVDLTLTGDPDDVEVVYLVTLGKG